MKLIKPMYGLVDAPKAWFDEAKTRILALIVQHPLDSCLFMAYDRPLSQEAEEPARLLAIFGIHVDDLLGCCNEQDPSTKALMDKIRGAFSFREWRSGAEMDELTYCGAQIIKTGDHQWKLQHQNYFKKQKPITVVKERQNQDLPVTEGERSALRGLLGALQWPSTQTTPWLQAAVSMMAGNVTKATTNTLAEANKILRYTKQNEDVGLEYRKVGTKEDITFVAFSDASFGCRSDMSSQGGFMLMMVNKTVAEGAEFTICWIGVHGSLHEWQDRLCQRNPKRQVRQLMPYSSPALSES